MINLSEYGSWRELHFEGGFALALPAGAEMDFTALQAARHFAGTLLLPLERLRWNGEERILYLQGGRRPYPEAAASMTVSSFLRTAANLLQTLEQCSETGFLDLSCFLLTPERLFLDSGNRPFPVFLPVSLPSLSPSELRMQVKNLLGRMQDSVPACFCMPEQAAVRRLFSLMEEGKLSFSRTAEELLLLIGEKKGPGCKERELTGWENSPESGSKYSSKNSSGYSNGYSSGYSSGNDREYGSGYSSEYRSRYSSENGNESLNETSREYSGGSRRGSCPEFRFCLLPLSGEDRNPLAPEKLPCMLGKAEGGADLQVPGRLVSRRHCRITENGGKLFVCDLGSTNGTFLNGRRLPAGQPEMLGNGDILKLAAAEFRVMLRGEEARI